MVNFPKKKKSLCQKCKQHKEHSISVYKKAKNTPHAQGNRRYKRKQRGYGGQTKPIFRKKAKTTKKVVLRLKCTTCKRISQVVLKRCKYFDLVNDSQKKKKGDVVY